MIRVIGGAAAFLGWLVRLLLLSWPLTIRALGFGLMTYSVWLSWPRLAWGFAGISILCLIMMTRPTDRRKT
jgi:hypothetical protein